MITDKVSKTIKEKLGSKYCRKIQKYLQDSVIEKSEGIPFTDQDIYNVMSGQRENLELESHILDAVISYQSGLEEIANKKRQLLSK